MTPIDKTDTNFMTLLSNITFPYYEMLQWSICDGRGMTPGNAYLLRHLVLSIFWTYTCSYCLNQFVLNLSWLSRLLHFKYSSVLARFSFNAWHTRRFQFLYNKRSVPVKPYSIFARLWRLYLKTFTIYSGMLLIRIKMRRSEAVV